MIELIWEEIEPLISESRQEGSTMQVVFTCPATGEVVESSGPIERGVKLEDVCSTTPDLLASIKQTLSSLLRGALRPTVRLAPEGLDADAPAFSASERNAAAVKAFQAVQGRFVRDGAAGRWIAAAGAEGLLCAFARQVGMAPVHDLKDREIASRMLVEVARADGVVTPAEWNFLAEFIPTDCGAVDTWMEAPPLTAAELDSASRGACRDTMLLLAWALAYVDADLDFEETGQLLEYAKGLRIPEARALELQRFAKRYLVEVAFERAYPRGKLKRKRRDEAVALGQRLQLAESVIDTIEERIKRRMGAA